LIFWKGLPKAHSVTLAHPQKVRTIAEAKIKADRIGAHILGQLLRADLIKQPAFWCNKRDCLMKWFGSVNFCC
jgi:hypothetical protein